MSTRGKVKPQTESARSDLCRKCEFMDSCGVRKLSRLKFTEGTMSCTQCIAFQEAKGLD